MDKDYFETLRGSVQEPVQVDTTSTESTGMATLTVKVDIDCKLYSDGDFLDLFEANKVKKIPIEVGQHLITVESEHYDGVSEDHVIDAAEVGKNYLLLVNGLKQKEQKENENKIKDAVGNGKAFYEKREYDSAINCLKDIAEIDNDAEAQLYMGLCYLYTERESLGISWLKKSAEQGNPLAQYNLGDYYELGNDYREAVKWFTLAAEQGNLDAQIALGHIFCTEFLDVYDEYKALKWFSEAAKQGHWESKRLMGYRYLKLKKYDKAYEIFVEINEDDALSDLREAIKDDNSYDKAIEIFTRLGDNYAIQSLKKRKEEEEFQEKQRKIIERHLKMFGGG